MGGMNPFNYQGDFLTDEELARQRAMAGGAPGVGAIAPGAPAVQVPAQQQQKPPAQIAMPAASTPAVSAGVIAPRTQKDMGELQRLETTGSGVSQVQQKHPIVGGLLRGLDIAGSIIAPRIAADIPGTTLHHEQLLNQSRGNIKQDVGEQGEEATAAHTEAETAAIPAQTAHTQAETNALENPQPKPKEEDWSVIPNEVGPHGEVFQQEKNSGQVRPVAAMAGVKPIKEPNEADKDKDIGDYLQAHGLPDSPANREKARGAIANRGKQEPGSYMPLYDPKSGQIVGAWDPKSGHLINAPNLPGTTSAGAGMENKATAATAKEAQPYQQMVDNAQEAHQLADMAEKGNASADVDLTLSFFKMMKGAGSSGIRFTGQEQNMIMNARNAGAGLEAIGQKVIGEGQPLTPDQRRNMVAVIDMHAKAAQAHLAGMHGGQGGGEQPAAQPVFAKNPKTGARVVSNDGGKTWAPAQ